jgi:2'-5' RNA ligase
MTDKKLIRTFLAIDLPEEIKVQIENIQSRLKASVKGIRWTRPEGIHLTLKFFGNISENEIADISKVVEKNTVDIRPLSLKVSTLGTFPNLKRPRVLWLGISGSVEKLSDLQKEIEKDLESIGFQTENRAFRAHLTLGRIKSPKNVKGLSEIIKKEEIYDAGSFCAGGLTLLKSDLTPQGAIYTKLAYFPFDG